MRRFAFILVIMALSFSMAHAITIGSCADGTQYGKCSTVNPGSWCTGIMASPTLGALLSKCPCANYQGWVQQGDGDSAVCVQAKCADGTLNG